MDEEPIEPEPVGRTPARIIQDAREEKAVDFLMRGENPYQHLDELGYAHKQRVQTLMQRPTFKEKLERRRAEAKVDTDEIIGTLVSQMRGDIGEIMAEDGTIDLKLAMDKGLTHLIQKLDIVERSKKEKDGSVTFTRRYVVRLYDSQEAAGKLAKIFGLEKRKAANPFDERERARNAVADYKRRALKQRGIEPTDAEAVLALEQVIPNLSELIN